MRLIDANAIKLEKGFFEKVDSVPKFYEWLGKQPTVDAVPVVHGEMYAMEYDNPETGEFEQIYFQCSVCWEFFYGIAECEGKRFNYCPNCGARMKGAGE